MDVQDPRPVDFDQYSPLPTHSLFDQSFCLALSISFFLRCVLYERWQPIRLRMAAQPPQVNQLELVEGLDEQIHTLLEDFNNTRLEDFNIPVSHGIDFFDGIDGRDQDTTGAIKSKKALGADDEADYSGSVDEVLPTLQWTRLTDALLSAYLRCSAAVVSRTSYFPIAIDIE
ncbi:hypothetical protein CEK25_004976 [Fusarium fujikuroi]|nr:hypothetical protein CEK25_004976 [Fusarium fujikuroi]